jgi:hypothetical protein
MFGQKQWYEIASAYGRRQCLSLRKFGFLNFQRSSAFRVAVECFEKIDEIR